jgi:hypothetical protein
MQCVHAIALQYMADHCCICCKFIPQMKQHSLSFVLYFLCVISRMTYLRPFNALSVLRT